MARILLIDDDADFRAMLRAKLIHFGHVVIEARNGREGMELFPYADAEVVITDIVMPEKEGIEVLMELRNRQPPVKIIAISGCGPQGAGDYLHMAQMLGAAKVLAKPFTDEALVAAVDALVAEHPPTPDGA